MTCSSSSAEASAGAVTSGAAPCQRLPIGNVRMIIRAAIALAIAIALAVATGVLGPAPALAATTDGTPDTAFSSNTGAGFDGPVTSVGLQPDGKIIVVGLFTTFAGQSSNNIARLDADGTLDTGFTAGSGFDDQPSAVALQSDGKILVVGQFTTFDGVAVGGIARLNADGTLDTTFASNVGTGADSVVRAVATQADGKIIIAGQFSDFDGQTSGKIARLNADGSLDMSFSSATGAGFDRTAFSLAVQSNNQILVGGDFTTYNGESTHKMARLNANGTLDSTFTTNNGSGFGSGTTNVQAIATQPNGKIVVGGRFTTVNGVASNYIARFDTSGTPDSTFSANIGDGFDNQVFTLSVQPDGMIVVGGRFSTVNNETSEYIARLSADGTPDTDFTTNLGSGFDGFVHATGIQVDGGIIAGGSFSLVNGQTSEKIARLSGSSLPSAPDAPTDVVASAADGSASVSWVAPLDNGGSTITGYTVTASLGGATCAVTAAATSCEVPGLTNGVAVTFTVTATNAFGESQPSAPSGAVTPNGGGAITGPPKRPQDVTVSGGAFSKTYRVTWQAPKSAVGRPTTSYKLIVKQNGVKRVIVRKNLPSIQLAYKLKRKFLLKNTVRTRGDMRGNVYRYSARVRAVNELGESPVSAARFRIVTRG